MGQPHLGGVDEPGPSFGPTLSRPPSLATGSTSRSIAGAVLAVVIAFVFRGPGGGKSGSGAAQGDIFTETYQAGKS